MEDVDEDALGRGEFGTFTADCFFNPLGVTLSNSVDLNSVFTKVDCVGSSILNATHPEDFSGRLNDATPSSVVLAPVESSTISSFACGSSVVFLFWDSQAKQKR